MPQDLVSGSLSRRTGTGAGGGLNPAGRRTVRVILLDRKEHIVVTEKNARLADVFGRVCQHVNLKETDYFGLAMFKEGEFQFIENDTKLHKLAPKIWKSKDCPVDEPLLTFHFRVQFYVDNISLLKERTTRLQYYLQLRDNLLHYRQSVSEEKCFLLAGYALQADYGNYNSEKHAGCYFDPREFFPAWVVMRHGQDFITNHMPTIHRDMSGMPHAEACAYYIRDVCMPPTPHNMHFYRLRRRKYDQLPGSVWLAICPKGLEIYEEVNDFKSHYSTFLWPHIRKLSCEKKKFEIVADGFAEHRFVYYSSSKESGESLLNMCRATHRFHLAQLPLVSELCRLEERDRRGPHQEMYIHSPNSEVSGYDRRSISNRSRASSIPASSTSERPGSGQMSSSARANNLRGASSPPDATGYYESDSNRDVQEIMIDSPPHLLSSSLFTRVTPVSGDQSHFWTPGYSSQQSGFDNPGFSGVVDQQRGLSASNSSASLRALAVGGGGSFIRSSTSASSTDGGGFMPLSLPKTSDNNATNSDKVYSESSAYGGGGVHGKQGSGLSSSSRSTVVVNAASLQRNLPAGATLNDFVDQLLAGDQAALRSVPPRKSSLNNPRVNGGQSNDVSVIRSISLRQPTARANTGDVWPANQRLTTAMAQSHLNLTPVPVEAHFQRIPFASPMTVNSNPVQSSVMLQPPMSMPSSDRQTPSSYVVTSSDYRHSAPCNDYESTMQTVGPLHSTPKLHAAYQQHTAAAAAVASSSSSTPNSILSQPNENFTASSGQYFDSSVGVGLHAEPSSNFYNGGGGGNNARSVVYNDSSPSAIAATVTDNSKPQFANDDEIAVANGVVYPTPSSNYRQPPSYELAQTRRLTATSMLAATPTNHRFEVRNSSDRSQRYFTELRNGITATSSHNNINTDFSRDRVDGPLAYFPNGTSRMNGSAVSQVPGDDTNNEVKELATVHGVHMNGFISTAPTAVTQLKHTPSSSSSPKSVPALRQQNQLWPLSQSQPQRQPSSASTDSGDDAKAQCPQHGSGLDLVEMVRKNIQGQPTVPMLKALCNDPTLRNSCTCNISQLRAGSSGGETTPSTAVTTRRLSLSHVPVPSWELYDLSHAGSTASSGRPYSWSSEHHAAQLLGQLQLANIEYEDNSQQYLRVNNVEDGLLLQQQQQQAANQVGSRNRGLVYRHSDGSAFQRAAASRFSPHHCDVISPIPDFITA